MKNRFNKYQIVLAACFLFNMIGLSVWAQQTTAGDPITLTLSELALIDTNHAPVTLELTTSTPGGSIASTGSNTDMWIKVSAINPGSAKRKVTAKITGTVPAGTSLTLIPAAATATNSAGLLGTAISSAITLTTTDQDIVTNIGSCYTGTGATDGYQATINWILDNPTVNYGQLDADASTSVTLYLTLTAAQ